MRVLGVICAKNVGSVLLGGCILQYWKFRGVSTACRCPMCCSRVTKLTPEASLLNQQEEEVTKVMEQVQKYNRFFVGGVRGLVQSGQDLCWSGNSTLRARQSFKFKKFYVHGLE
ncbi:unnamed protein product [Dovyalis caffra]|uniref:Uncharacterized protein n=1 Tax=Dovyalis caffra TaxID=77055 RepID=A0AAV1R7C6_9ROSI|nr:unnamed protein product [Dovyalis caffra]